MDHFQSKRALVSDDAVVAIDVSFRAVGHSHSHACIIADHIFRAGGNLIAAVQDQMAGQHADASASIGGYRGAGLGAIDIEGPAADADAGARAVFYCAIGNVHQRIDAGKADAQAVLDRDACEIDSGIVVDKRTAAAIESNVLDSDPL